MMATKLGPSCSSHCQVASLYDTKAYFIFRSWFANLSPAYLPPLIRFQGFFPPSAILTPRLLGTVECLSAYKLLHVTNRGPKRASTSRFYASMSHKSRPDIFWNLCSRQVYPTTQDARLIYNVITLFFVQFPFQRFLPTYLMGRNVVGRKWRKFRPPPSHKYAPL